jgi:hypothetical protein
VDQPDHQDENLNEVEREALRSILKTWGRFPAPAEPDFNCLLNEVIAALQEGFDAEELVSVIQNEFFSHFGAAGPEQDIIEVADTISSWWNGRSSGGELNP